MIGEVLGSGVKARDAGGAGSGRQREHKRWGKIYHILLSIQNMFTSPDLIPRVTSTVLIVFNCFCLLDCIPQSAILYKARPHEVQFGPELQLHSFQVYFLVNPTPVIRGERQG